MKLVQLSWLLPVLALLCASSQLTHGQCQYSVTVIEAPSCPPMGIPRISIGDMNENGDISGAFHICDIGAKTPCLWTKSGGIQLLGLPAGTSFGTAVDLNVEPRLVVATSTQTFLWQDGVYVELEPAPGSNPRIEGIAISDAGVVVGRRTLPGGDGRRQAFTWNERDGFTDLGFMGSDHSVAIAVNEKGNVAGSIGDITDGEGFLWQDGATLTLDAIPGTTSSNVKAMNNAAHLACQGKAPKGDPSGLEITPAVWKNGSWDVLPVPMWATRAIVSGINDGGQVVGGAESDTQLAALLWQNGAVYDLADLIPAGMDLPLHRGKAINNTGQIAVSEDGPRVYLLTPSSFPAGDTNQDCQVGALDLFTVLSAWGSSSASADVDGDGTVGFGDLLLLLANWG